MAVVRITATVRVKVWELRFGGIVAVTCAATPLLHTLTVSSTWTSYDTVQNGHAQSNSLKASN